MSDADIHAATTWLAAQPLPASSKPAAALPAAPAGQVVPACGSATAPRGTRP
jgi:hypothetical protein